MENDPVQFPSVEFFTLFFLTGSLSSNILCKGGEALLQQADGLPPGARPAALSACGGPLPQQREETPLHSRVIFNVYK